MTSIIEKYNLLSDFESGKCKSFRSFRGTNESIPYSQIYESNVSGLPLSSYRDDNGKLNFVFTGDTHALVIGSTRSGKTTGYIIPTLFAKACQKEKDNLFISDPKGELYKLTSEHLRKNGYVVKTINLRDFKHGECWNPLIDLRKKIDNLIDLQEKEETLDGVYCTEFDKKKSVRIQKQLAKLDTEINVTRVLIDNMVDNLSDTITTDDHSIKTDPYWTDSAKSVLKAFLYALVEDYERGIISKDKFSIKTILTLTSELKITDSLYSNIVDGGFFTSRNTSSKAYRFFYSTIICNSQRTAQCIMSALSQLLLPYSEAYTRLVTSADTLNLDSLINSKKPFALYVIYRDELKTSYDVIKLFVSITYTKLIEKAHTMPSYKLERPFYFILDEFGCLPAINNFDNVIAACGGRNIWFVTVLQSYAQLEGNYGPNTAAIIRENLNMHVFFGTANPETKQAFSRECGQKTIIAPTAALSGEQDRISHFELSNVPVVPVSSLNHLECGDCYITMANAEAVLASHFERNYLCAEFNGSMADINKYKCPINPFDKTYDFIWNISCNNANSYEDENEEESEEEEQNDTNEENENSDDDPDTEEDDPDTEDDDLDIEDDDLDGDSKYANESGESFLSIFDYFTIYDKTRGNTEKKDTDTDDEDLHHFGTEDNELKTEDDDTDNE